VKIFNLKIQVEGEEEHASNMVVKAWVFLFRRFYIPLSYHEAHIRQYGPGKYLDIDIFQIFLEF
jgi:hypothetical protein